MLKVVIIEDEQPAMQSLEQELEDSYSAVNIVARLSSVTSSINWFLDNRGTYDLVFMDIHLQDGLCFHIFESCTIDTPVIFTTAYDMYLMQAFEHNGLDYLLKPLDKEKLQASLKKYNTMQKHFTGNYEKIAEQVANNVLKRSRILVRRGLEFQIVRTDEIAYFFTEHKVVFLVDKNSHKYMVEKNNLMELEEELDEKIFYRANRKYIVNVNYIKRFKPVERSKISLELAVPANEDIIISQENSGAFRKWISEI